ncbi:hypothetical protein ACFLZC_00415 [Patescibacteria group bacterium]
MKKGRIHLNILLLFSLFLMFGCQTILLPVSQNTITSPFKSYKEAGDVYIYEIQEGKTTGEELTILGMGHTSPNVETWDHITVEKMFMHNPNIRFEDLRENVQTFLNAKNRGLALKISFGETKKKSKGNVILHFLNLLRIEKTSGWNFEGLILLVDNVVVYKLMPPKGIVFIDKETVKRTPLGPLTNISDVPRIFP